MRYQIGISKVAEAAIGQLDRRTYEAVKSAIERLREDPERRGSPLFGSLIGFRSYRTGGQRYRIIYKVDTERAIVLVALVGLRKDGDKRDVYALAQRLVRLGLLDLR